MKRQESPWLQPGEYVKLSTWGVLRTLFMSDTVIRVENLGKKYIIGHQQQRERYTALRDVLANSAKGLAKRFNPRARVVNPNFEEFWALKDVSFEVKRGDRIGIIGRNGAGKSTLLKILSRITEPTEGRVSIKGRVASLLEVGTGFHPELTGRENIYLNGAILGMSKREIRRKFDEIVAFAEIERFLDTPVKRYSSGMYVRLAFAVAAHLEPEILVVDEVLAVGDAQFQKKCLGKMEDVAINEGRTVLFVSHQMTAINALCSSGILMNRGYLKNIGRVQDITQEYLTEVFDACDHLSQSWYSIKQEVLSEANSSHGFSFSKIELSNSKSPQKSARTGDPLSIIIHYKNKYSFTSPAFVVQIKNFYGQEIIRLSTMPISGYKIDKLYNEGIIELTIDSLPLTSGRYIVDIGFVQERIEWITKLEDVIDMYIVPQDIYKSGFLLDNTRGIITVQHQWEHHEKRN